MAKRIVYHALIVNKGARCFSNLTVMCDILKMKESSQRLSHRARVNGGYPIIGYSTLSKTRVIITKIPVETKSTQKHKEYEMLEVNYEIDYIDTENPSVEVIDIRKNKRGFDI